MRRMAALLAITALVVSGLSSPTGLAAVSRQDVEDARQGLRAVAARLETRVAEYDSALVSEVDLIDRIDRLRVELTSTERELALARIAARERVVEMYMSAGARSTDVVLVTGDITEVPARRAYLDTVAATDREVVGRLMAVQADHGRLQEQLAGALDEQRSVRLAVEALLNEIYGELAEAGTRYQAVTAEWERQEAERIRREEEERQRRLFLSTSTTTTTTRPPPPTTTTMTTASPTTTTGGGGATTSTTRVPPSTTTTTRPPPTTTTTTLPPEPPPPPGTKACPVDGATAFRDSWGEQRPGNRSHAGVDMMANRGIPLVAIESGTIWSPNWHYAGGLGLYIKGDSGDLWYYAHMDRYAARIEGGARVRAGQRVGFVGDTGNASIPHLHLGWQPDGGAHQNPYPVVKRLCG